MSGDVCGILCFTNSSLGFEILELGFRILSLGFYRLSVSGLVAEGFCELRIFLSLNLQDIPKPATLVAEIARP